MKFMSVGVGDVVCDIGAIAELTASVGVSNLIRNVGSNAELVSSNLMVIAS